MIEKLFTFTGDVVEADQLLIQYHECTLVTQIGEYKVDSYFDFIDVNFAEGKMNLFKIFDPEVEGVHVDTYDCDDSYEALSDGTFQKRHLFNLRLKCSLMPDGKEKRIYYQDIVYAVCNIIDNYNKSSVVCGTVNNPSTEVQDTIEDVFNRLKEFESV